MGTEMRFARLDEAEDVMRFMHEHWRKNHVLSRHKDLLLHEFQQGDRLNIAIARNDDGELIGIFGVIPYNSREIPDLAGSLWKVLPTETPVLGLKLRQYCLSEYPHRFFGAPGAGLQTKPIYHVLKMNWHRMHQYVLLNRSTSDYALAAVASLDLLPHEPEGKPEGHLQKLSVDELGDFPFDACDHLVPFKDEAYVTRRYFGYPIFSYDVLGYSRDGQLCNLIVCRTDEHEGHTARRMVDFYGEEEHMSDIALLLQAHIEEEGHEYLDCISQGLDHASMVAAGFHDLDLDSEQVIIPNYYGPFTQRNVPVYCVSDRTDLRFRQFKADGDQDRPSGV